MNGEAVIEENSLKDAVFDVRAGVCAGGVQAVGGIGDERVFRRTGWARA